ncbi:integration host factor, actinobacterial type [Nonomuraea thailandensis]|uniref:integration host factor, actinobacterial type n=1 Tax=Nonomuraea thailandensis TaxID=1188745 RepID=UPI0027E32680|nr:integration host factor, actinobacterial type [Nonomuraea thailandensis]
MCEEPSMAVLTLTPEQRAMAVVKAAEARKARSELLAAVRAGTVTVAEVFARAEEETLVKKTRVVQVLRAMPGYGPAQVAALIAICGVEVKRRVGGLDQAQRERLLTALAR